jgi:hypothetical protein
MVYNITNISHMANQSGVLGVTQAVNNHLMGGWLGSLLLIGITIIILTSLVFSTNDLQRSIAATSFISFALALFLRAMGLIPDMAIFITLICCAASLAFSWKTR